MLHNTSAQAICDTLNTGTYVLIGDIDDKKVHLY